MLCVLQQKIARAVSHQEHWFSVRIINPLTNGQMLIKLVANNLLSQNDFLIWEELCLCENIYSLRLAKKFVLFLDTTGCSSELIFWKRIFGILRICFINTSRKSLLFIWTYRNYFLNETSEYWGTLFHLWKEVSSHITTKLHFTQGIWTLYYNCIIAWLIEIDLFKQMRLCFFSPCCIEFKMAQ